jgi:hypothetical protein
MNVKNSVLFSLFVFAVIPTESLLSSVCDGGVCRGELASSHIEALAKSVFLNVNDNIPKNIKVSCEKEDNNNWRCLIQQVPVKDEVIPPGRIWTLSIDTMKGTYTIFGGL